MCETTGCYATGRAAKQPTVRTVGAPPSPAATLRYVYEGRRREAAVGMHGLPIFKCPPPLKNKNPLQFFLNFLDSASGRWFSSVHLFLSQMFFWRVANIKTLINVPVRPGAVTSPKVDKPISLS